jgi:hypothetical protein
VRLEIRRAKGRIRETRVQDPKDPSAQIYTTDADFIDEPETKAPWVTFQFNLQRSSVEPEDVQIIDLEQEFSPDHGTSESAHCDTPHDGIKSESSYTQTPQVLSQFFSFLKQILRSLGLEG